MKEVKFLHKIEYTNKNTISTLDIANSLMANEFIISSLKEVFEDCIDGIAVDIKISFKEASHNSPLKEVFGITLFATFQEDLRKETPVIIEKLTGINISENYDTIITVFSFMLVYYGMSVICERVKGIKPVGIESSKQAMVQYIQNQYNISPDKIDASVKKVLKNKKNILKNIKNFLSPAKKDNEAEIIGGGVKINKQDLSEFPTDVEIEMEKEEEKQEPMQNIDIEIRATDIDRNKMGWAGVLKTIDNFSHRRLKIQIYPTINLQDIGDKRFINGDIILVSRLQEDGSYKPYMFHLLKINKNDNS